MTIKAVLFDFDGTLADTLPVSFKAFQSVFKKYDNRDVSREELVAMFGPTEDEIISRNLAAKGSVAEAIREYYLLYEQGHSSQVHRSDEIERMLKTIKSWGLKIGVITGKSREALQISSESLQMSRFFDIVITGDDVNKPKPDPEGIFTALEALQVSREESLFLGDSSADIKAGKAAGLRTYGVQWLSTYQSAVFEVEPDQLFTQVEPFLQMVGTEADLSLRWLDWAKQIQSIAQTGLTYAKDVYDIERYEALRQLSIDILDQYTFAGTEKIKLSFASESGYATPKVDVRGVIFEDDKILLVREKLDGAWSLPGGWADIGLSPSEVAVKEIQEESGFTAEPVRLLAVLDKKFHGHPPEPYHIYKIFILCRIVGGAAISGTETSEVGFFADNELPELSLERNTEKQILTMFEFLRDSDKKVLMD